MPEENALPSTETPSSAGPVTPSGSQPPAAPTDAPTGGESAPAATGGASLPPYVAADPPSSPPENHPVAQPSEASEPAVQPVNSTLPSAGSNLTPDDAAVPTTGSGTPALQRPDAPGELTSTVGAPVSPHGDMSIKDMFVNADPVVQGVMLLLLLASLATWVVIIEKTVILRSVSRSVMLFKKASAKEGTEVSETGFPPLTLPMVKAGIRESGDSSGRETRSDYRERVERSMRTELSGLMDKIGYRVMFLATVGAVSPFVGLFGTVWGIMHSFVGIAASGETTLAVVAPGIAEALFATAMGLVAAIPAVIAYNKITGAMKKVTKEALSAIGFLGNKLARRHFDGLETEENQWTPGN